jgi:LacI family transcriptional regulator
MVSQQDVAKAAGVSASTASLALNNHPRVAPKTTLRVHQVAERLGYVPNHAARQLVRARFGASSHHQLRQIGLVSCVTPTKTDALNPTDLAFLNGVEQGVADRSGVLIYLRHADEKGARRLADLTRAATVEGWIAFGHVGDAEAGLLQRLGCPWVALGDHACAAPVHQVNLDFRSMGDLAAQHLLELGHRRIGFIGSRMQYAYAKMIFAAFSEALAAAGVSPSAPLQLGYNGTDEEVRAWLKSVFADFKGQEATMPTAFVCAQPGDSAALLSVCAEQGIRVPEQLSLVYCEMSDSIAFVDGITRVEASAVEAGRSAVSLLADVASRSDGPPRQLLVQAQVVPGRTAALNPHPAHAATGEAS